MARKTGKLAIRIDPSIKEALREVAEKEHRTVSNMVEVMVLKYTKNIRTPFGAVSDRNTEEKISVSDKTRKTS